MKLNNYTSLEQINQDDLYLFMTTTLFEIQTKNENDIILKNLLSKETLNEIIKNIEWNLINVSEEKFVELLNEQIDKLNRKKPILSDNIKLKTYLSTGLVDIKYCLDYNNFSEYEELKKDYVININYITGSNYTIVLEQKGFDLISGIDIKEALNILKREIINRAKERNIQNQIQF